MYLFKRVGIGIRTVMIMLCFEKCLIVKDFDNGHNDAASARSGGRGKNVGTSVVNVNAKDKGGNSKGNEGGGKGGTVMNIISADAQRFLDIMPSLSNLAVAPPTVLAAIVLMWSYIGVSSLLGLFVMCLCVVPMKRCTRAQKRAQQLRARRADERLKILGEAVTGMKTVKLNGWEDAFERSVGDTRAREAKALDRFVRVKAWTMFMSLTVPVMATVATFALYIGIHSVPPAPADAFAVVALFKLIQSPFKSMTEGMASVSQCDVAIQRLQRFARAANVPPAPRLATCDHALNEAVADEGIDDIDSTMICAFVPRGTRVQWELSTSKSASTKAATSASLAVPFSLELPELELRRREILFIVGSVGSGKSTFLQALLGEVPAALLTSTDILADRIAPSLAAEEQSPIAAAELESNLTRGTADTEAGLNVMSTAPVARLRSPIAYVPQTPFIINATVKQNVLFGRPFNEARYRASLHAACLDADLKQFPAHDQTEIGEKGLNLSGGQRQRVALARAVYEPAAVLLVDDALAALDAHVGAQVYERIFGRNGVCAQAGTAVVLVTNQLYLVQREAREAKQAAKSTGTKQQQPVPSTDVSQADANVGSRQHTEVRVAVLDAGRVAEIGTAVEVAGHEEQNADKAPSISTPFQRLLNVDTISQGANEQKASASSQDATFAQQTVQEIATPSTAKSPIKPVAEADAQNSKSSESMTSRASVTPSATISSSTLSLAAVREGKQLVKVEQRHRGAVPLSMYSAFFAAVQRPAWVVSMLSLFFVAEALLALQDWLLAEWSSKGSQHFGTAAPSVQRHIIGYLCAFFAASAVILIRSMQWATFTVHTASKVHNSALNSLLRAPMAWFDVTPFGRIMNRFAVDQNELDERLPAMFEMALQFLARTLAIIALACVPSPWLAPALLPVGWVFWSIKELFRRSSREAMRLRAVTNSPIFSTTEEVLEGVASVRAFGLQTHWRSRFESQLTENTSWAVYKLALDQWLLERLTCVSGVIIGGAAFACVLNRSKTAEHPEFAALALAYTLTLCVELRFGVRCATEVEAKLNSLQRLQEIIDVESQHDKIVPYVTDENAGKASVAATVARTRRNSSFERPPSSGVLDERWPRSGELVLASTLRMRYRPKLPLVLQLNRTITIRSGERIGIVGRTGSGKSSLLSALFRIVECERDSNEVKPPITLDGVDIGAVPLLDLRRAMAVVAQEPLLFEGSIRSNIDPFDKHSDHEIWAALEQCNLAHAVRTMTGGLGLAAPIAERGANLSVGERQLLCFGRALLRRDEVRLLLLDEATAAVDPRTDAQIQRAVRKHFKRATVLAIAHRINTVLDFDRIVVMSGGDIAEFDTPTHLLAQPNSVFAKLAAEAGVGSVPLYIRSFSGDGIQAVIERHTSARDREH
eukprot:g2436.t1